MNPTTILGVVAPVHALHGEAFGLLAADPEGREEATGEGLEVQDLRLDRGRPEATVVRAPQPAVEGASLVLGCDRHPMRGFADRDDRGVFVGGDRLDGVWECLGSQRACQRARFASTMPRSITGTGVSRSASVRPASSNWKRCSRFMPLLPQAVTVSRLTITAPGVK